MRIPRIHIGQTFSIIANVQGFPVPSYLWVQFYPILVDRLFPCSQLFAGYNIIICQRVNCINAQAQSLLDYAYPNVYAFNTNIH